MNVDKPDKAVPIFPQRTQNKLCDITVTTQTVKTVLKAMKTSKTPGPDEANPLFQNCAGKLSCPLTYLFKECMAHGMWPSSGETGCINPIHKRGTKTEVKNYRPVTLLSMISSHGKSSDRSPHRTSAAQGVIVGPAVRIL